MPVLPVMILQGGILFPTLFVKFLTQAEVESLLQKKGKTVAAMIAEYSPTNREDQLTMMLELEFWDELGDNRKLPPRRYYFDFGRWAWIPQLAERSDAQQ